ncbi:MAG: tRNA uridine(34) 5-carboxymethylaminomethyl modification radical SAM/GNAT enzyme Elp3 [Candidatus Heimdallarchaeota archaeon]|nr:tRNA uridine(34) 5-carboxymethylaminomethyl modification radical SAM/GNAT enzyme Elp3 [Candidatus Heimdallarchaeota archaeon]
MTPKSDDIVAVEELVLALIDDTNPSKKKLQVLKREMAKKYKLNRFLRNSEILEQLDSMQTLTSENKEFLLDFLRVRKVRTISGIAVVAVMTKPDPCPGNCIYCPDVPGAPKSYTGREPAAMRGIQNDFLPKKQVIARLNQLQAIGHPLDKIHLVVMGGTFLSTPDEYQKYFTKECLDGINNEVSFSLELAKKNSQISLRRNVGITFETRPDYCKPIHVNRMLDLGGTWVEIGVQTLSDKVLKFVQRHHTKKDVADAILFARDGGLKVTVHMMPNLFQTPEEDIKMFEKLYSDPKYIPDAIKIYPTLVLPNTRLFEMWQKNEYIPYSSDLVVEVISRIKEITPSFVRIQRVQRDIPAYLITEGVRYGNLREMAEELLHKRGGSCSCIRCREVGHQTIKNDNSWESKDKQFKVHTYKASQGIEHFISYETKDSKTLFGFLRLREPSSSAFRSEIKEQPTSIIREIHVYGRMVSLGKTPQDFEWQHRGFGQKMIQMAEEISIERGYEKILVTSGLGVRDYYRKLGFTQDGPYMGKEI